MGYSTEDVPRDRNENGAKVRTFKKLDAGMWEQVDRGKGNALHLHGPGYELTSLSGIATLIKDGKSRIDEVNVQDNELSSLIDLSSLHHLKRLYASRNKIAYICAREYDAKLNRWPEKMVSLVELKLSRNRLVEIPDLSSMPSLRILDLSVNSITASSFHEIGNGKYLEEINLSSNQLVWDTMENFTRSSRVFRETTKMKRIFLAQNGVVDLFPRYAYFILAHIRSKSKLAGTRAIQQVDDFLVDRNMNERADAIRKSKEFIDSLSQDGGIGRQGASTSAALRPTVSNSLGISNVHDNDNIRRQIELALQSGSEEDFQPSHHQTTHGSTNYNTPFPKISELNALLDECFIHPECCSRNLSDLLVDAQRIAERPREHQLLFKIDPTHSAMLEIDTFLQNIALLSERQPQLTRILLTILVFLSTVGEHQFDKRCIGQLRNMMSAGEQHAKEVIEVVSEHMIPWLDRTPDTATRNSIMMNLIELARGARNFENAQLSILDGAIGLISAQLRRTPGSPAPVDSIVEMASVASATSRLARELGGLDLCSSIAEELRDTKSGTLRYQHLLVLISNMSLYDVHDLEGLGDQESLGTGSDGGSPVSQNEGDLDSSSYPNYFSASQADHSMRHRSAELFGKSRVHHVVLRALRQLVEEKEVHPTDQSSDTSIRDCILCLSALSLSPLVFQELVVDVSRYLDLLLDLYKPNALAGPIILSSVFEAITAILRSPRGWFQATFDNVFAKISGKLQGISPLLQYIGEKGARFNQMCKLVPREEEVHFRGEIKVLANLRSKSMHRLLVSVINLITFYNEEAAHGLNQLAQRIAQDLKEKKRETYLFNCLQTPSEDVRIAVLRCLQAIKLANLEIDELQYLLDFFENSINISSWKVGTVLAESFRFLTKICLTTTSVGVTFRQDYAEKAASAAFTILERNERRNTTAHPGDFHEKRVLSTSCVQFLQACSRYRNLRSFLRRHDILKKMVNVLYAEDECAGHVKLHVVNDDIEVSRDMYDPNMIERTLPGRQVEYLLQALFGDHSVSPAGVVAPRILRRIADVLMGLPDPSLQFLRQGWLDDESSSFAHEPGTYESGLQTDIQETSAWLLREDGVHAGFRTIVNRHTHDEKRMPAFWNMLVGSQVGCTDEWVTRALNTQGDNADELQQHQLLIDFQGLERLLLYLVGAAEKDLSASDESPPSLLDPASNPHHSSSSPLQSSSVRLMFDKFVMPDVNTDLETYVQSLKQVDGIPPPPMQPDSSIGAPVLNFGAAALGTGEQSQQADGKAPLNAISGRDVLLKYFMEEALAGENCMDAQQDPLRPAFSSTRGILIPTPAQNSTSFLADEDADVVMFASNAADIFRRETETTDTLVAALRVIYSLLKDGRPNTVMSAKQNLRMPKRLRILAFVCAGSQERPVWPQALVGAKFMAIAYELCVMPGIRREEPCDQLNVYGIICTISKRILSTLRRYAELQSMTESDYVTAMHTTRTLALIASQLPLLYLPWYGDDSSEATFTARAKTRDAAWRMLMPFNGVIRSCIAILIGCSGQKQQRSSELELILVALREQITQILVSAFIMSPESRYEILEEFVRVQVDGRTMMRNSYIQELLDRVKEATFTNELQAFMAKEQHFSFHLKKSRRESILAAVSPFERAEAGEVPTPSRGGFFAMCVGFRTPAAKPESPGVFSNTGYSSYSGGIDASSGEKLRKMWAIEPPPALRRSDFNSLSPARSNVSGTSQRKTDVPKVSSNVDAQEQIQEDASMSGVAANNVNAGVTSGCTERQPWEKDRIGQERILESAFCDVMESPGSQQLRRCLLVLTSEAYYLYEEPQAGHGWQFGPSLKSQNPTDDLYTSPRRYGDAIIVKRKDLKPRLIWRKPYRALQRVVLGLYGQRIHIKHKFSDLRDRMDPVALTCLTYVSGVAARLYSFFMQMSREWAEVELLLGAEKSQINPPPLEDDVPFREALAEETEVLTAAEVIDEASDPGFHSHPSSPQLHTLHLGNPASFSGSQPSVLDFASSTCLFNEIPGMLATQVRIWRKGQLLPRLIICTSKFFMILETHWEHWIFPVNFRLERAQYPSGQMFSSPNDGPRAESADLADAHRAKYLTAINAKLENRRQEEREKRRLLLQRDAGKRVKHSLLELNEVMVSRGENPVLKVGFEKVSTRGGASAAANTRSGSMNAGNQHHTKSEHYYEIQFYDHDTRDRWCNWLIPRLQD